MKRNITLVLVGLLLIVLALPLQAQESTITVWLTGSDAQAAALQTAADVWTETSGVGVVVEAVPWSDAYTRALTAVSSGDGADILMGGMSWGISLGEIDGMINLSEQFPDEIADIASISNEGFYEAIVTVDGDVYGIPYNLDTYLMYYMPEVLAAAGIDSAPATWEELTAAIEALQAAGHLGAAYNWGNLSWLSFQNFLYQAGGTWYTEDCSAAAINSEEALTALEFYTSLYEEYGFPAEAADTGSAFSTGEYPIVFDGEWTSTGINASFPELEGQWTAAPLPAGPSGANTAFIGGKMMGIFSASTNVDAAFEFMVWLATPEAAQLQTEAYFASNEVFVPPQPDNGQFIMGDAAIGEALGAQLTDAAGPPNCAGWEENNAQVDIILDAVIFEGMDFEDALAELEDLLNDGIEEYGG